MRCSLAVAAEDTTLSVLSIQALRPRWRAPTPCRDHDNHALRICYATDGLCTRATYWPTGTIRCGMYPRNTKRERIVAVSGPTTSSPYGAGTVGNDSTKVRTRGPNSLPLIQTIHPTAQPTTTPHSSVQRSAIRKAVPDDMANLGDVEAGIVSVARNQRPVRVRRGFRDLGRG